MQKWLIPLVLTALLLAAGCPMTKHSEQVKRNEARLAAEGIVPLARGDLAPQFSAELADGGTFSIPDDLGGGQVLLFFYPADFTPNTTRDLLQLGKLQDELNDNGILVYGISGGTAAEHHDYAGRYGITVPLLADPKLEIAKQYGCAPEQAEFAQRTLVGIDSDSTIAFFERGFQVYGKAQSILDWFAGKPTPEEAAEAGESEAEPEGGKLAELDEEQRRAIYIKIKQARDRAWAEAEDQFPLDAEGTEQREQVRKQGELAMKLEEQYLNEEAKAEGLTFDELEQIEDEGDTTNWPGIETVEETTEKPAADS